MLSAPLSSGTGDPRASEDLVSPACASADTGFPAGPPGAQTQGQVSHGLLLLSGLAPTWDRTTVEGPMQRRCER